MFGVLGDVMVISEFTPSHPHTITPSHTHPHTITLSQEEILLTILRRYHYNHWLHFSVSYAGKCWQTVNDCPTNITTGMTGHVPGPIIVFNFEYGKDYSGPGYVTSSTIW